MAIGVRRKAAFARGERYAISLREGDTRADLEATVRWTRSSWYGGSPGNGKGEYFQTAGLTLAVPLTPQAEKRWQALREKVQEGMGSLEIQLSPL